LINIDQYFCVAEATPPACLLALSAEARCVLSLQCLAREIRGAASQQVLPRPTCDFQQGDDPSPAGPDREFCVTSLKPPPDVRVQQLIARAERLIVLGNLESQRQDAEVATVGQGFPGQVLSHGGIPFLEIWALYHPVPD
jgi:hypothetical protein